MKIILLCSFSIMYLFSIAQVSSSGNLVNNEGASLKYYEMYDNAGNKIKNSGEDGVNGTPMLRENWASGVLKLKNGKEFIDTSMNFSLFENKLFFRKENRVFIVSLPITEFVLTYHTDENREEKFHFKNGYPSYDKKDASTFYEIKYAGKVLELLKWEQKKVQENFSYGSVREWEFKLFQQWYIYDSRTDRMYSIDHTFNTLKAASAAYANSIDAYLAVHHKVNQNSDSELMALVAEMDSKLSEGN